MGYAAPPEDNTYKPTRPKGGYLDTTPAPTQPDPFAGLDRLGPLSEFEDMITPYKPEEVQPKPQDQPVADLFTNPTPALSTRAGEMDPLGGPRRASDLVPQDPTGPGGEPAGDPNNPDPPGPDNQGPGYNDKGEPEIDTDSLHDPSQNDRGINDPEGGWRSGGGVPNRENWTDDEVQAEADRLRDLGLTADDVAGLNTQWGNGAGFYNAVYTAMGGGGEEGDGEPMAPQEVFDAVANEELFNFEASALVGDGKSGKHYEATYDPKTETWYIRNADGEFEVWDGADVPKVEDVFDMDEDGNITGVKPEFGGWSNDPDYVPIAERDGDGGPDTDPLIARLTELANGISDEDLQAWAKRMDEGGSAEERTGADWWKGILAMKKGFTDIYHRPYTSPPDDFWKLVEEYPDLADLIT